MKRMILVVAIAPSLATGLFAQPCNYDVSTSDTTCTSGHDCIERTGCTTVQFTPTCSGLYNIEAWTGDGRTKCCEGELNACVNVYENGVFIQGANCHVSPCSDCYESCESTVCLEANHDYELYVCLIGCGGENCGMPPYCAAYGRVKYNGNPCP